MYKKGAGNDKQGKDAGNRTLCPHRNFSQAIKERTHCIRNWFKRILKSGFLNAGSSCMTKEIVKSEKVGQP